MTYARLRELVSGYRYLHQVVRYVHRDLEEKHVGLEDGGRLCVFDLSTCVPLDAHSEGATGTSYAGAALRSACGSCSCC